MYTVRCDKAEKRVRQRVEEGRVNIGSGGAEEGVWFVTLFESVCVWV